MQEVNTAGLKKTPMKPLDMVAKYIDYYVMAKGEKPKSVHLSASDYDRLEAALQAEKRELKGRAFRGVELLRDSR